MGFFSLGGRTALATAAGFSKDLLHKNECTVCPLNDAKICSPKMKPTGSREPVIYVLGEAPGSEEDRLGRPFVGPSGKLLKRYLKPEVQELVRWGNVIRCYPGKDDGRHVGLRASPRYSRRRGFEFLHFPRSEIKLCHSRRESSELQIAITAPI